MVCFRRRRKRIKIQDGFFYYSAPKMTKCQPLKEISELFLPKDELFPTVGTVKKLENLPKVDT